MLPPLNTTRKYLESLNGHIRVTVHDLVLLDKQPRTQPPLWVNTLGFLAGKGVRLETTRGGFAVDWRGRFQR